MGTLSRVPAATTQPAIEAWFATDASGATHLISGKCTQCATYVFPPRENNCPNPACDSRHPSPGSAVARYRKESAVEDVLASPVVADPPRQLDICATSDGAGALIVASADAECELVCQNLSKVRTQVQVRQAMIQA